MASSIDFVIIVQVMGVVVKANFVDENNEQIKELFSSTFSDWLKIKFSPRSSEFVKEDLRCSEKIW